MRVPNDGLGVPLRNRDVFILVLGVAGCGKSRFISRLTGRVVPSEGPHAESTAKVAAYTWQKDETTTVHLIDTPGFGHAERSDAATLLDITAWLVQAYSRGINLGGVIFVHPVTESSQDASVRYSLLLTEHLLGEQALPITSLVTTKWDLVAEAEGTALVEELVKNEVVWGHMQAVGALVEKFDDDYITAEAIVTRIISRNSEAVLNVQGQMIDEHMPLNRTLAGTAIADDLMRSREAEQRRHDGAAKTITHTSLAGNHEVVREAVETLNSSKARIAFLSREMESLKVDADALVHRRDRAAE